MRQRLPVLALLALLMGPRLVASAEPNLPSKDSTRAAPSVVSLQRTPAPKPSTPRDSDLVDAIDLKPTWIAGAKSAILPGWGQFQTGHPIRGSILMIFDPWLYGDAIFRTWSAIPKLRDKASVLEARTSEFAATHRVRSDSLLSADTNAFARQDSTRLAILRDSSSLIRGRARISADYRNGELAWAIGMHVYSIVDAAEDAWLASGGKRPETELTSALWRSLLIPGWGQVYNAHYSKAALLYMGIGGSLVSFFSRQEMVDFWKDQTDLALSQNRSTTVPAQQTEFFRKRRNQYVWGLGVVYVYQALDAAVDARLSRFNRPFPLSLSPLPDPDRPGLVARLRF
jgi:hypothetical protein